MNHILIAMVIQFVAALVAGNWWLGAAAGAFYFIGREIAQAEYRAIYNYYGRKRANAPWWCGFERRAWTRKSVLDWAAPSLAVVAVAIVASRHLPMS